MHDQIYMNQWLLTMTVVIDQNRIYILMRWYRTPCPLSQFKSIVCSLHRTHLYPIIVRNFYSTPNYHVASISTAQEFLFVTKKSYNLLQ